MMMLALLSSTAFAQKSLATMTGQPDPSSITGGLGLTWINGQEYYLINFAPDLAFGKFGVGIGHQSAYQQFGPENPESGFRFNGVRLCPHDPLCALGT